MTDDTDRLAQLPWDKPTVLTAFLCCAIWSDGEIADEEEYELHALAVRTRTLHQLSIEQFFDTVQALTRMAYAAGTDAVFNAAASSFEDGEGFAESIYAHCLDLMYADRKLTAAEQAFVDHLARSLAVNTDTATRVQCVIARKNAF